jgi:hypothetical protein
MCCGSRLASLRGSRPGINIDSSLKTRPCSVELLSLIAPPDAQAAASCSVELLSPIAPPTRKRRSLTAFACLSHRPRSLLVPIDWGQSIYHPSDGVFQCRAIVPNSSPRRASGGVLQFSAVYPTGHGTSWFRSIGDNRSTIPATASCSVELLSPIAPPDALAAAACGFRLFVPPATVPPGSDRLGQSIYHPSDGVLQCRAIVPNSSPDAQAAESYGFRLLIPPATVPPGSDRLGTIDLPSQRRF